MVDPQTSPPGPQDPETPTFGVLNTSPESPLVVSPGETQ